MGDARNWGTRRFSIERRRFRTVKKSRASHLEWGFVLNLAPSATSGSYVVLARKWRPAQFSDIVGQAPVVRTIMNAIRSERIHQAYLLTGSRGIGKTSIARIFAKIVRCPNTVWDQNTLRSCDQCSSCREIALGNSVDVIEIDGASNNGVDHVREIRENAKFLPASGSRKVYIIDEVHMLSTAAFNALLKTLEEPPAHVIFVFATTEPHKIPPTILSRCQRFDLRRVTMTQIQTRLAEVTRAEGIQVEPGALALIARAAEGGMRDALSLLDQVIAFSGSTITAEAVRDSIGLVESQTVLRILRGILGRNALEALSAVDQAHQQGHDLKVLTRSLIEFLHGALLAKVGAAASATLELAEEESKELQALAALRPLEELEMIFQALNQGVEWITRSPQPKIVLDVLLIKCATAEILVYAHETGPASSPVSNSTASRPVAPVQAAAPVSAPRTIAPVQDAVSSSASSIRAALEATSSQNTAQPVTAAPVSLPPKSQPLAQSVSPAAQPTFEDLIERVRLHRPLLATVLEHGRCKKFPDHGDNTLIIQFKEQDGYYREQLQARVYAEQLSIICKDYFGRVIQTKIEVASAAEEAAAPMESVAARREREHRERESSTREQAQNHPIIREAQSLFGGELGPIEIVEDERV